MGRVGLVIAVVLASVVAGFVTTRATSPLSADVTLIVAITVVLVLPLVGRPFDPFDPAFLFSAVWGLMFVLRPLAMMDREEFWLRETYNIAPGVTKALVAGLVGAVAFHVGYRLAARKQFKPQRVTLGRPPIYVPAATAAIAIAAMGVLSGTNLTTAQAAGGAYLYLAPLAAVPAAMLFMLRGNYVSGWVVTAVAVLYFWDFGQRAFVLWPIVAMLVLIYLHRDRRPNLVVAGLVFVLVFLPFSNLFLLARDTGKPFTELIERPEVRNPIYAAESFVLSETSAMFAALALQMQTEGRVWNHDPGHEVTSTLATWVPSSVWPDKPVNPPELLYSRFFRENYQDSKASTAFTLAGEFYYDSGWFGVVVGMLLVGVGAGLLWRWLLARSRDPWAWAVYAPSLLLGLILFRGGASLTFGLALFVLGPLFAARVITVRAPVAAPAPQPA